jgi:hypothetical protein
MKDTHGMVEWQPVLLPPQQASCSGHDKTIRVRYEPPTAVGMAFMWTISTEVIVVMVDEAQGHKQHTAQDEPETCELSPVLSMPSGM